MLTILQKIKDLVSTQTVKLEQHEAKDGSILDIDKLEAGGLINIVSENENVPANGEYVVENEGITYKIVAKEGVIDTIEEVPAVEPIEPAAAADVIPVEAVEAPITEAPITEEVKPNDLEAKVNDLESKVNELAEIIFELIKKMNGEDLKKEIKTEMKIEKLSKVSEIKENKKYTGTDFILYNMYK